MEKKEFDPEEFGRQLSQAGDAFTKGLLAWSHSLAFGSLATYLKNDDPASAREILRKIPDDALTAYAEPTRLLAELVAMERMARAATVTDGAPLEPVDPEPAPRRKPKPRSPFAQAVECPVCFADAFDPCTVGGGELPDGEEHVERLALSTRRRDRGV